VNRGPNRRYLEEFLHVAVVQGYTAIRPVSLRPTRMDEDLTAQLGVPGWSHLSFVGYKDIFEFSR